MTLLGSPQAGKNGIKEIEQNQGKILIIMKIAVMMGFEEVELLKGGNKSLKVFIAAEIGFFDGRFFLSTSCHNERFFF